MNDQRALTELDENGPLKRADDRSEIVFEQFEQLRIADVASGDQQESMGRLLEQERINEIPVLGNDRALFALRNPVYVPVFRSIPIRKVCRVNGVVSSLPHPTREPQRQLRVEKELHYARACMLLIRLRRAAKVSTADTSSASRSS